MITRRVSVSISSPSSVDSRDDGMVELRVEDDASGECLAQVTIPPGRWWRLCQGTTQHHDAIMSDHLDRIGKRLEVRQVSLPAELADDTERDRRRDTYKAAEDQAPDFLDFQEHSIRRTNRGRVAVLRRWVDSE